VGVENSIRGWTDQAGRARGCLDGGGDKAGKLVNLAGTDFLSSVHALLQSLKLAIVDLESSVEGIG